MTQLQDCPEGVFAPILVKAASNDFTQFRKLRGLCRGFRNVPKEYVWKNVSLENFNHFEWEDGYERNQWFKRCVEAGNVEALFRKGLEFFGLSHKGNQWEVSLKELKDSGYTPAIYAYGLVSLFYGHREAGFQCLTPLRVTRSESDFLRVIEECRHKSQKVTAREHRPWYFSVHPLEDPGLLICKCKPDCCGQSSTQVLNPRNNMCTCYEICYFDHESALVTRGNAFIERI